MTLDYMQKIATELTSREIQQLLALLQPLDSESDPLADLDDEQRQGFVSRIAVAYADLERIVLAAIRLQILYLAKQASGDPQIFGARGGINALYVLLETLQAYKNEHLNNIEEQRKADNLSDAPVPSVTERG